MIILTDATKLCKIIKLYVFFLKKTYFSLCIVYKRPNDVI